MSTGMPSRSEHDLTEEERRLFVDAHAELRAAVAAFEPFRGKELEPQTAVPIASAKDPKEMREAKERIEAAEARIWELRERLLGWARPPWAPPATLVSDWILEDDPGYDDVIDPARS